MGPEEIREKKGTPLRAKRWARGLLRHNWVIEFLGLLALSAFIQLAGPLMWTADVVKVLVDGFSSVPLLGVMFVLMFVTLGIWCVTSTFDLDRPLLPVFKWVFTTARTYSLSVAAIALVGLLGGASPSEPCRNLLFAAVIGGPCGTMFLVLGQRKRQLAKTGGGSISVWAGVLANSWLTVLAVASFWGFVNFQGVVAQLKEAHLAAVPQSASSRAGSCDL